MATNIVMDFGYENTDFTRRFKIADVDATLAADSSTVTNKIKAVNASLAGGTSGNLDTFFRSDDYDAAENIGKFTGITAAKIVTEEVTNITLDTEGDATNG